ncbi:MAG: hypothetical protein NT036_04075, partial [Candidatus Omnitrophica bacterium]|nr:hypothetical protein [Candidatus Omnitrophota bacterium]
MSPQNIPYSFSVPADKRQAVLAEIKDTNKEASDVEAAIVSNGLAIYDGACWQIALSAFGSKADAAKADALTDVLLNGSLGKQDTIKHAEGLYYRIINANGEFSFTNPLTGTADTWKDWDPRTGDNAWAGIIGPLQVAYKKYDGKIPADAKELKLARETARAAMLLIDNETGGFRMAPKGIGPKNNPLKFYNAISTENNISLYAGLRMLYRITGEEKYKAAMDGIERFLKSAFNKNTNTFDQLISYKDGNWTSNGQFATDCQTWAISVLGPKKIDEIFGAGTAMKIWRATKAKAGQVNEANELIGVAYTENQKNVISIEWTAGAIAAARKTADHYKDSDSAGSKQALADAVTMRQGIEGHRIDLGGGKAAYPYASERVHILFDTGWWTPPASVASTASTAWVAFIDSGFDPFVLGGGAPAAVVTPEAKPAPAAVVQEGTVVVVPQKPALAEPSKEQYPNALIKEYEKERSALGISNEEVTINPSDIHPENVPLLVPDVTSPDVMAGARTQDEQLARLANLRNDFTDSLRKGVEKLRGRLSDLRKAMPYARDVIFELNEKIDRQEAAIEEFARTTFTTHKELKAKAGTLKRNTQVLYAQVIEFDRKTGKAQQDRNKKNGEEAARKEREAYEKYKKESLATMGTDKLYEAKLLEKLTPKKNQRVLFQVKGQTENGKPYKSVHVLTPHMLMLSQFGGGIDVVDLKSINRKDPRTMAGRKVEFFYHEGLGRHYVEPDDPLATHAKLDGDPWKTFAIKRETKAILYKEDGSRELVSSPKDGVKRKFQIRYGSDESAKWTDISFPELFMKRSMEGIDLGKEMTLKDFIELYLQQSLAAEIGKIDKELAGVNIQYVTFKRIGPNINAYLGGPNIAAIEIEVRFDSQTIPAIKTARFNQITQSKKFKELTTALTKEAIQHYTELSRLNDTNEIALRQCETAKNRLDKSLGRKLRDEERKEIESFYVTSNQNLQKVRNITRLAQNDIRAKLGLTNPYFKDWVIKVAGLSGKNKTSREALNLDMRYSHESMMADLVASTESIGTLGRPDWSLFLTAGVSVKAGPSINLSAVLSITDFGYTEACKEAGWAEKHAKEISAVMAILERVRGMQEGAIQSSYVAEQINNKNKEIAAAQTILKELTEGETFIGSARAIHDAYADLYLLNQEKLALEELGQFVYYTQDPLTGKVLRKEAAMPKGLENPTLADLLKYVNNYYESKKMVVRPNVVKMGGKECDIEYNDKNEEYWTERDGSIWDRDGRTTGSFNPGQVTKEFKKGYKSRGVIEARAIRRKDGKVFIFNKGELEKEKIRGKYIFSSQTVIRPELREAMGKSYANVVEIHGQEYYIEYNETNKRYWTERDGSPWPWDRDGRSTGSFSSDQVATQEKKGYKSRDDVWAIARSRKKDGKVFIFTRKEFEDEQLKHRYTFSVQAGAPDGLAKAMEKSGEEIKLVYDMSVKQFPALYRADFAQAMKEATEKGGEARLLQYNPYIYLMVGVELSKMAQPSVALMVEFSIWQQERLACYKMLKEAETNAGKYNAEMITNFHYKTIINGYYRIMEIRKAVEGLDKSIEVLEDNYQDALRKYNQENQAENQANVSKALLRLLQAKSLRRQYAMWIEMTELQIKDVMSLPVNAKLNIKFSKGELDQILKEAGSDVARYCQANYKPLASIKMAEELQNAAIHRLGAANAPDPMRITVGVGYPSGIILDLGEPIVRGLIEPLLNLFGVKTERQLKQKRWQIAEGIAERNANVASILARHGRRQNIRELEENLKKNDADIERLKKAIDIVRELRDKTIDPKVTTRGQYNQIRLELINYEALLDYALIQRETINNSLMLDRPFTQDGMKVADKTAAIKQSWFSYLTELRKYAVTIDRINELEKKLANKPFLTDKYSDGSKVKDVEKELESLNAPISIPGLEARDAESDPKKVIASMPVIDYIEKTLNSGQSLIKERRLFRGVSIEKTMAAKRSWFAYLTELRKYAVTIDRINELEKKLAKKPFLSDKYPDGSKVKDLEKELESLKKDRGNLKQKLANLRDEFAKQIEGKAEMPGYEALDAESNPGKVIASMPVIKYVQDERQLEQSLLDAWMYEGLTDKEIAAAEEKARVPAPVVIRDLNSLIDGSKLLRGAEAIKALEKKLANRPFFTDIYPDGTRVEDVKKELESLK